MCLTSIQVLSHLDPGPTILVSPPYMYCLNPIQVHIVTSHLPPDSVSTPSRSRYSCVTSTQVTSHLHPGLKLYGAPLSMPCLTSNQAIHQGCISPHTHVLISASHHHPGGVSPPSSSRNLHLSSIQVLSQSHPGLKMCVSHPFRPCLRFIQVTEFLSHLHLSTA